MLGLMWRDGNLARGAEGPGRDWPYRFDQSLGDVVVYSGVRVCLSAPTNPAC